MKKTTCFVLAIFALGFFVLADTFVPAPLLKSGIIPGDSSKAAAGDLSSETSAREAADALKANLTLDNLSEGAAANAGLMEAGTRPVFEFNMIYYDPGTSNSIISTEIELKASDQNVWTNELGEADFLYWGDTLEFDSEAYTTLDFTDMGMKVFYCDYSSAENNRKYKEFQVGTPETYLTDAIGEEGYVSRILVVPSITNRVGELYTWMTEDNEDIIWVARLRGSTDTGPTNSAGRLLWQPVTPSEWRSTDIPVAP